MVVVVLDVVVLFCFFWEVRGGWAVGGYVVLCPITELCCFRVQ